MHHTKEKALPVKQSASPNITNTTPNNIKLGILTPPKCKSCGTKISPNIGLVCTQCAAWIAIYQHHRIIKQIRLGGWL